MITIILYDRYINTRNNEIGDIITLKGGQTQYLLYKLYYCNILYYNKIERVQEAGFWKNYYSRSPTLILHDTIDT